MNTNISKGLSQNARRTKTLTGEIRTLSMVGSSLIIISVQIIALLVITASMQNDLVAKASITADEIQQLLVEPLYNVDEEQAKRIGLALLSSGRVSGMVLDSSVSGVLLSVPGAQGSAMRIKPLFREIRYKDLPLGTVWLYFSDSDIKRVQYLFLSIATMVIFSVILANLLVNRFFVERRFRQPMDEIRRGIDTIAMGSYDFQIRDTPFSDLNILVHTINEMASRISDKNIELLKLNTQLENRVEERTKELEISVQELRAAQELLVKTEKLTALGDLSAGIAHELNTPLGAILSANRQVGDFLEHRFSELAQFLDKANERQYAFFLKVLELGLRPGTLDTSEIPMDRRKVVRSVAADLTSAGIANGSAIADVLVDIGINGDMMEIVAFLADGDAEATLSHAARVIQAIKMSRITAIAVTKAASVVAALRSYVSPGSQDPDSVVHIDEDIRTVLVLMHNMLKYGIRTTAEFGGACVRGSSEKLSQVWLNLIKNSAQAMGFKGELLIRTRMNKEMAEVSIIDSGPGIPDDIRARIFEPFFTTKKQGEGLGLGLDICKRIVELHGGTIVVDSVPGRTEFMVSLPAVLEANA
ncbi:MAG TPA: ATP-binding protein [bacterium]|nr:ATP-binding protein [bacterium]